MKERIVAAVVGAHEKCEDAVQTFERCPKGRHLAYEEGSFTCSGKP